MWRSFGRVESWQDRRYFYDCRSRQGTPHVVLQMTLAGAAFYEDASGRQLVRPGQAFMNHIPGPFSYGYAAEVGGVYKQVYVSMVGSQAKVLAGEITRRFGHVLNLGLGSPAHTLMMAMVHRPRGEAHAPDRFNLSGQVYQLFMTILSQLSQSRLSQTPHISDAVSYIHQQATDASFNVQALAQQMGFSREYLARQFQHALGISPSEAITQRRLELACNHLRQSDAKLDAVAAAAGFSSANYFCRLFRLHFGVTPAYYRAHREMILQPRQVVRSRSSAR